MDRKTEKFKEQNSLVALQTDYKHSARVHMREIM